MGESSHGDLMMPPEKHVLAHEVVLFNTIASKQLIALSKRPGESCTASTPQPCERKLRSKRLSSMTMLQRPDYHHSPTVLFPFVGVFFLINCFLGWFSSFLCHSQNNHCRTVKCFWISAKPKLKFLGPSCNYRLVILHY